jgi:2-succinyl-5-enolpyruvyl-6-hydroxy-3-cyclohexene-1-carboxylate synthase
MIHQKQHIADLVEIFAQKGVSNIIISPGSRNAPLIEAFYKRFGEKCINIVDERSAGYVGLGIARNRQLPVILLCTSGTAVLNYGPALAEAYQQQIPLIAITADRPVEWIDQIDNQTIRQANIFSNIVKSSFSLSQAPIKIDDLWYVHRTINEAYNTAINNPAGPVHINVPLGESLYEALPEAQEGIRIIDSAKLSVNIELSQELISQWKNAGKILIVHGQDIPQSEVSFYLEKLLEDPRVCVVAENISNVTTSKSIESLDIILSNFKIVNSLKPDLLIVSGLQVVSKRLKSFLRSAENIRCWRIGVEKNIIDTYQQVDIVLNYPSKIVYKELGNLCLKDSKSDFQSRWSEAKDQVSKIRTMILQEIPFSDMKVMENILQSVPSDALLELGNSSVIRYSQLFNTRKDLVYYSNRGVSGIDGCLSSAVGTALSTKKMIVAVVGDLSFVYDSNALWNRNLPANLRIIVINNKGGGIFSLIEGPKKTTSFRQYVNAYHPVELKKLTEAFGLNYNYASDEKELKDVLNQFYNSSDKASLLEVFTSSEISSTAYKRIFEIEL